MTVELNHDDERNTIDARITSVHNVAIGDTMRLPQSRMTQKGQVTIPVEVRKQMGLKPSDRVEFEIVDGYAIVRPVRSSILDAYGAVEPRNRPEDFRAIREAFERGVADEVVASMAREAPATT